MLKLLVPIEDAAEILGVGTHKFRQILAAHPEAAKGATVRLGSRTTRYRVADIEALAETITGLSGKRKVRS